MNNLAEYVPVIIVIFLTIMMPIILSRSNYNDKYADEIKNGSMPKFSQILKKNIKQLLLLPFLIFIVFCFILAFGLWFFIMNSFLVFLIPFIIAYCAYVLISTILKREIP